MVFAVIIRFVISGIVSLLAIIKAQTMETRDIKSTVSKMPGHYPSSFCRYDIVSEKINLTPHQIVLSIGRWCYIHNTLRYIKF